MTVVSSTGTAAQKAIQIPNQFTRQKAAETTFAWEQARQGRERRLDKVREKFYAISVERRITHPAVKLIADQAKRRLFA